MRPETIGRQATFLLTTTGAVRYAPVDNYKNMTPKPQNDALRGSLDLLVLKTLSLTAMHGWGISLRIQQISKGALEVNQGSLYPALQRLEKSGLIDSEWGITDNNRRARYYRITAAGRRALGQELDSWRKFSAGLEAVLREG
jgi:PadR family transcriptional regulator, regulatory protein PadR